MPTEVPTPAQIRRTSRTITGFTWLLTGAVVTVSMSTASPFIGHHSPGWGTGPVMSAGVDGCFILSLQADGTLARYGVSGGRWPAAFRWVTGLATVWLNIGASALTKDLVGVVVHLIPPLLLLLVAEAGPAYRRALARLAHNARQHEVEWLREPVATPVPTEVPTTPATAISAPAQAPEPAPEPAVEAPASGSVATPAVPVGTEVPTPVTTTRFEVPTAGPEEPAEEAGEPPTDAEDDFYGVPVGTWTLPVDTAVPTPAHPVDTDPLVPGHPVPDPEPEVAEEDREEPAAVRLDEESAAAVIEEGWRKGWSQRETARRATRAPSYVGRVYRQLSQQHPEQLHALPQSDEEQAS